MCLIFFASEEHPRYRLILAANRDEFYRRPTESAHRWLDPAGVIAGRDLISGGSWLGVTDHGRWAAITNYRSKEELDAFSGRSRGLLVNDFLTGSQPPADFIRQLAAMDRSYRGFNLLVGDASSVWYHSNRDHYPRRLPPGCYGLSNHLLDTPWPKVSRGKAEFVEAVKPRGINDKRLFDLLADRDTPPDLELPDTGFGLEWERILAPRFIQSAKYGTRSSTILLIGWDGTIVFRERTFDREPQKWREVLIEAGKE
jgi:uncharacterized protein with NRDE domain